MMTTSIEFIKVRIVKKNSYKKKKSYLIESDGRLQDMSNHECSGRAHRQRKLRCGGLDGKW